MIETGYKPEGSLGAWYQGQNAAYAEDAQRQDALQSYISNLKKEQEYIGWEARNQLLEARHSRE